jgi:hypothetical protein
MGGLAGVIFFPHGPAGPRAWELGVGVHVPHKLHTAYFILHSGNLVCLLVLVLVPSACWSLVSR